MSGLTLDAGGLIAIERNDRPMTDLLVRAMARKLRIVVPAGALAQVWRDGARQVRLARFLASKAVTVEPFDDRRARAAGQLCGVKGTSDVVDASVVVGARERGDTVVTSDPQDLERLDPTLELIVV